MGSVTQLMAPVLPEVAGYVEAFGADSVLGWAWSPRAVGQRAEVELRLGDATVAKATADRPRADLAVNGIGDGKHAFELSIPEAYRSRVAELVVFARMGEGTAVSIGAPPPPDTVADQLGVVRKGMDVLVGSQRVLHRMLQAALAGREASSESQALAALAAKQSELGEQLAVVERFIVRLDAQFASQAPKHPAGNPVPRAALWALGVAGSALVVSIVGLVHSLGG